MKRASGVLMPISSLPGAYSGGSFGAEARQFVDQLAEGGFSYWQVLPFCLSDEYHSPYKSFSAFSISPNYIDLPSLRDMGLLTVAEMRLAEQSTPYACEFDRLDRERLPLLLRAADRFGEPIEMTKFFDTHPHVSDFCRFMALRVANGGRLWNVWEIPTPDPETLRVFRFCEYIAYTQWMAVKAYANERGIRVIGDLPIYVAHDSSDVWSAPDAFELDRDRMPIEVAGVPPDYFSEDGQLWGNPLYRWSAMKKDGYSWWRARMRFMTELFDDVRIDHFRGLESYYSIPATASTAKCGRWRKGPGLPFLRAMREESGDALLIAEDLGGITDGVRALLRESGCPGMRVFQFAFLGDPESPHLPHNYPAHCVAYSGTHDNNTLLGYIWEQDDETRRHLLEYCGFFGSNWDSREAYRAVLRTLFASHADLLILPIQDLLLFGRDTRINTPGTAQGNWSFRVTDAQLSNLDLAFFRVQNRLYGRLHEPAENEETPSAEECPTDTPDN